MKKFLILGTALLMLSACRTTKTDVGQFRETPTEDYVYAKGKQVWLFWGLLPVGRTKVNTPSSGNCQVVTRTNIADFLISGIWHGANFTFIILLNKVLFPTLGFPIIATTFSIIFGP